MLHPRWVKHRAPYSRDVSVRYSIWSTQNRSLDQAMTVTPPHPDRNGETSRKNFLRYDNQFADWTSQMVNAVVQEPAASPSPTPERPAGVAGKPAVAAKADVGVQPPPPQPAPHKPLHRKLQPRPEPSAEELKKKFLAFERSAQRGDLKAMSDLALCYAGGRGTSQDWDKAFDWFQRGANRRKQPMHVGARPLFCRRERRLQRFCHGRQVERKSGRKRGNRRDDPTRLPLRSGERRAGIRHSAPRGTARRLRPATAWE